MKAVRLHSRAGPESLVYEDAPIPELGPEDALVKVHAAGLTPTEFAWNSTFTTREKKSRLPVIPSFEFAGTVVRTASDVQELKAGDAVYGLQDFWRDGAAAEYVAIQASDLAPKPKSLSFPEAAAVPLSGLTAWQALFDHANLSKGETVLIHGAGGGVGTFAVQLARWRGAHVIATCSKGKAELVMSLGAERVIDYSTTSFQDELSQLDVVLDTVGGEVLENSWGVLRQGGTLVTIVGDAPQEKAAKLKVKGSSILVEPKRDGLVELGTLIDAGEVRPVIGESFPLSLAREAYVKGQAGHNSGKTILVVAG